MAKNDEPAAPRRQFGALCYRIRKSGVEVLLVTSRDTGRWVIPKGWPMASLDPHEAAMREAWEEAGIEGRVTTQPLGRYGYAKRLTPSRAVECEVEVFALEASRVAARFPERRQRRRKWFRPAKAATKVAEPSLAKLLREFKG